MDTEVEFLRLVTGEDVVSECEIHEEFYRLYNPCKVVYLSSQNQGFLSISLMQWVFSKISEEQIFDLPKNQILIKSKPTENMIEHYFSSVDHFINSSKKESLSFEGTIDSDDEELECPASSKETLQMLENLLDSIKDKKGKLH
jgi:hypothetical protein